MERALEGGDFVIGTFRQDGQVQAFNGRYAGRALGVKADIRNELEIEKAFEVIGATFGHFDVLVNNAGFGFLGAIEETSLSEARDVFETNFFGTLRVVQAALPLLKKGKQSHIIQVSSHGGMKAFAGFGIYNASKFALEAVSEALALEVAPLGIHVTIVEPGPFRTNFAGPSMTHAQRTILDYDNTAGLLRKKMKDIHGVQEGDPRKAAHAIFNVVHSNHPPLRLPLGKTAINTISAKLESVKQDLERTRELAENVEYSML